MLVLSHPGADYSLMYPTVYHIRAVFSMRRRPFAAGQIAPGVPKGNTGPQLRKSVTPAPLCPVRPGRAAGVVFPLPAALAVNFLGMLIDLTVPYVMGRRAGQKLVGTILARYPKLEVFLEKQQDHAFFLNFLLRVFSCLPGDVVTLYFGATGVPLWQNLVGGGLGVLPGMVLGTVLGKSLEDPASPAFWVSAGLSVGLAAASTVFYGLYLRRQKRKEGRS